MGYVARGLRALRPPSRLRGPQHAMPRGQVGRGHGGALRRSGAHCPGAFNGGGGERINPGGRQAPWIRLIPHPVRTGPRECSCRPEGGLSRPGESAIETQCIETLDRRRGTGAGMCVVAEQFGVAVAAAERLDRVDLGRQRHRARANALRELPAGDTVSPGLGLSGRHRDAELPTLRHHHV